jgi:GH15 family glucan-1,4-alpha-glucosidase
LSGCGSGGRTGGYAPIGDYAAIGDGRTVALVAADGSIDWLCLPAPDSPSVFGALLDPSKGGRFTLAPEEPFEAERRYLPETNVLETTYQTASGSLRVTEAMTLDDGGLQPWVELVRAVDGLSGEVSVAWSIEPRFGYGLETTELAMREGVPVARRGSDLLGMLTWQAGEPRVVPGRVDGRFRTQAGSRSLLALSAAHGEPLHLPPREGVERRLKGTVESWRRWVERHDYDGPWREEVIRSALVLKLLTHAPTGAVMAAPTTSLPERVGGGKNWDYRFAWVRDTSFALDALMRLDRREQAHASFTWLLETMTHTHPRVQPIYTVSGHVLRGPARDLPLAGYERSTPVRRGNDAASQPQLGSYGHLMMTTWHYVQEGNLLDATTRNRLAEVVDLVCELWEREDAGIWELKEQRHYTESKMGCWAALDRALRLVEACQLPARHASRWRREMERVREWIDEHCFSVARGCFVRDAASEELDAATLLASRLGYCDPRDPRLLATVDAVREQLGHGPCTYRYSGAQAEEGAFVACSFWLVEVLARAGRFEEAEQLMEEVLRLGSDLGLYAEQVNPETGELLGNFPQGLSHLALINAATLYHHSIERARR